MDASQDLAAVESAIGYGFADPSLLMDALTHTSYASENPVARSYERLEFLGDAVLELAVTDMIFAAGGGASEGAMTKLRASVVDEPTLANIAGTWSLADSVRLGVGEERSGGRTRPSILSDVVEAVLGAVFIDGGFDAAVRVVRTVMEPIIGERLSRRSTADSRSQLQELMAKHGSEVDFTYDRTGPDHDVVYTAEVLIDGIVSGSGSGGSKKAAAIDAARAALESRI